MPSDTTETAIQRFASGSEWLRADFHLHTKTDRTFAYAGSDDYYIKSYIDALAQAEIGIGLITNHNKFSAEEFRTLQRVARKRDIFLHPGVELSVSEGSNGLHVLIAFSDEWLTQGKDYVSQFIGSMFPGKVAEEYENENARSEYNLLQLVGELDRWARDYFIVFAHVERDKGLWEMLLGGRIGDFKNAAYEDIRARTLAFQQVKNRDRREKVKAWLGDWYPAEVEGSDCKNIEEIGRGPSTFIKLGAATFEALKFALADPASRVRSQKPEPKHSRVEGISFAGGILDAETIRFSPGLNTVIGIRGSGKSSIIEALRYDLDIPLGSKVVEDSYRHGMPRHTLGSGGKSKVIARDPHGRICEISRVFNEAPRITIDNTPQPSISISGNILRSPMYFGQKDLAATGEGFEKELIEKLVGADLGERRQAIEEQKERVGEIVDAILKLGTLEEKIEEQTKLRQNAEFGLRIFAEKGIEAQLQRQVDYDTDERRMSSMEESAGRLVSSIEGVILENEEALRRNTSVEPKSEPALYGAFLAEYSKILGILEELRSLAAKGRTIIDVLGTKKSAFGAIKSSLAEAFAESRRSIDTSLREKGLSSLNLEEFPRLKKGIEQASALLELLQKQGEKRNELATNLASELDALNDRWHEEFESLRERIAKINEGQSAIQITVGYKSDKSSYLEFFKSVFKGSRLRESTLDELADTYSDFIAMHRDYKTILTKLGTSSGAFDQYFSANLKALLTWQRPNTIEIEYRGKPLKEHSLGQRASALILFVLGQRDSDVVIIDQPEDDLDNQTIYSDVIKLLRSLKDDTQFIFATHNPNIPVLGDADQVIVCDYASERIKVQTGSIDDPSIQGRIVSIMEGGKEAFERRKRIYEIWKPSSSSK